MAKSDFICESCKKVITHSFFNPFSLKKYKCPKCGSVLCDDCIRKPLIGRPTCKKCHSTVLSYEFKDGEWTQI